VVLLDLRRLIGEYGDTPAAVMMTITEVAAVYRVTSGEIKRVL
jgi:hypothetical protein